jgi:hypothetical protein
MSKGSITPSERRCSVRSVVRITWVADAVDVPGLVVACALASHAARYDACAMRRGHEVTAASRADSVAAAREAAASQMSAGFA